MARIGDSLAGKRVYVTQIDAFMGPALGEAFREHGAQLYLTLSFNGFMCKFDRIYHFFF